MRQCGESKSIALDISKAFDRVRHDALVSKLIAFGVNNIFVRVMSSFLDNRGTSQKYSI